MDIHRCRFVNYPPSPINALAFSHSRGSAGQNQPLRLAIGRANGDIEIWDPRQGLWVHETTCKGGRERSVEGLVWIHDPDEEDESGFVTRGKLRLFSIGYSSTVTEWDLITGLPSTQSSGSHAEVWCIAAQPPVELTKGKKGVASGRSAERQDLVAGCADGTLVLLSTSEGELNFSRYLSRPTKKNARALSVAFQDRNTIVAGYADSTIRVFDVRNGNLLRTMSLGAGPSGGPKETLVWALQCLNDGTIVSGDSTGEVRFWDGKAYSQLQRIKGHEADTLCLAASADSRTVFSGGIDRRTVMYSPTDTAGRKKRWVKTAHRRFHKHDIKAMASFEDRKMSVVVSGGLDTSPIITPMRNFGQENQRTLPYAPQLPPLTSTGRYLVSWWDREISIWRVAPRNLEKIDIEDSTQEPNYQVVSRISLKGDENVSSVSISPSGTLLAVATVAETKLFRLREVKTHQKRALRVEKMQLPETFANSGERLVQFSPDSKWLLCVGIDSSVRLARITLPAMENDRPSVLPRPHSLKRMHRQRGAQNWLNGEWGSYDRTIVRVSFSADSRILAVSDLAGYIDTWVLEGTEDTTDPTGATDSQSSLNHASSSSGSDSDSDNERKTPVTIHGQRWIRNPKAHDLPRLPSNALVFSFRPSSPDDRLLILTAKHELQEIAVLAGRLTDWSRRNPPELLPEAFKLQRDRATGCVWDVETNGDRERVWLYGAGWLGMFDLAQDLPQPGASTAAAAEDDKATLAVNRRKRKREQAEEEEARAQRQSKKHTSGAGSRKPIGETGEGLSGGRVRKLNAEGVVVDGESAERSVGRRLRDGSGDDSEADDADGSSSEREGDARLIAYRRAPRKTNAGDSLSSEEDAGGDDDDDADSELDEASALAKAQSTDPTAGQKDRPPHFHITTTYRPILGVVPLSPAGNEGGRVTKPGRGTGLEVALVERPFWELELPPRFVSEKAGGGEDGER